MLFSGPPGADLQDALLGDPVQELGHVAWKGKGFAYLDCISAVFWGAEVGRMPYHAAVELSPLSNTCGGPLHMFSGPSLSPISPHARLCHAPFPLPLPQSQHPALHHAQ